MLNPLLAVGLFGAALALLLDAKESMPLPELQYEFEKFHSKIKLEDGDEKAKLREKRETLIRALRTNLSAGTPTFKFFNQGSYSTHTGVKPLDGNFDIDVGLVFELESEEYPDPVSLKKRVRDALHRNGRTVDIRRPCVTVNYMRGGEVAYHVDLAIYIRRSDGRLALAKGKENSEEDKRLWEDSDPRKLTQLICTAFDEPEDLEQYRRCIRYLKRWRDVQFSSGAPLSIALTIAAQRWFKPCKDASGRSSDLGAMLKWVSAMLERFQYSITSEGPHTRLKVELPVSPDGDLMARMTRKQMKIFEAKLRSLQVALRSACEHKRAEDACKVLNNQFGSDFPLLAEN